MEESDCCPCYLCSLAVQGGHHFCHPGLAGAHCDLPDHPDCAVAEGKRLECSQAGTVVLQGSGAGPDVVPAASRSMGLHQFLCAPGISGVEGE